MNFKEKVQALSAKEIIMAMVDGLKAEHVKINMGTFGEVESGVCIGCAATNTICEISGVVFNVDNIENRNIVLDVDYVFLSEFEKAIDWLRCGEINFYNSIAKVNGFATIKKIKELYLPELNTDDWKEDIESYIELANNQ